MLCDVKLGGWVCEFLGFCSGIVEVPVVLFCDAVSMGSWRLVLHEMTGFS